MLFYERWGTNLLIKVIDGLTCYTDDLRKEMAKMSMANPPSEPQPTYHILVGCVPREAKIHPPVTAEEIERMLVNIEQHAMTVLREAELLAHFAKTLEHKAGELRAAIADLPKG
jgi:hypothetical protein